ncbi:MAG: DUF1127 domain-containing protein [Paracoccaceae bacterium]
MALFDVIHSTTMAPSRVNLFAFARTAAAVRRQRAALKRLEDSELVDLGISRTDADAEANRPFWDVPNTWRR